MKTPALLLGACLLISACASPQEIEAQRQRQTQEDIQTCLSYGLHQGTEAFAMCRLELDIARKQRYYNYPYPYHYYPYTGYHAGIGFGY